MGKNWRWSVLLAMLFVGIGCMAAAAASYAITTIFTVQDGDRVAGPRPFFAWQLNGLPLEQVVLEIELDGQRVPGVMDRHTASVAYQPTADLALGPHRVVYRAVQRGTVLYSYVAQFVLRESVAIPPMEAADGEAAVAVVNDLRRRAGLALVIPEPRLAVAAQHHSDYSKLHGISGHFEQPDWTGFTGRTPQERMNAAGYLGFAVGEVGTSEAGSIVGAIRTLFDAPYHRIVFLNPHFTQIGVGMNRQTDGTGNQSIFINFGTQRPETETRLVRYPYPGQEDAKVSWLNQEIPNPLAAYGLGRVYTGYPISVAVHDATTAELRMDKAVLWDGQGREVPCYVVDSRRDKQNSARSIFLIPQQVLTPGMTYRVLVAGSRVLATTGQEERLETNWQFTTARELQITQGQILTLGGEEFLDVYADNGTLPDLECQVLTEDGILVQTYRAGRGFTRWGAVEFTPGSSFRVVVQSDIFNQMKQYRAEIQGEPGKRSVRITPVAG